LTNRFYQAFLSVFLGLFLVFPAYSEGFSQGKLKIPFEPKLELKDKKIAQSKKTELLLTFKIEKDAYIYKDSLSVNVTPVKGIKVGSPMLPKSEKHMDKFLKISKEIYPKSFTIRIPLEVTGQAKPGKSDLLSVVGYRGCSKTICFIPQEKTISAHLEILKKK
jgi:thiol:disulfide interchange protein